MNTIYDYVLVTVKNGCGATAVVLVMERLVTTLILFMMVIVLFFIVMVLIGMVVALYKMFVIFVDLLLRLCWLWCC